MPWDPQLVQNRGCTHVFCVCPSWMPPRISPVPQAWFFSKTSLVFVRGPECALHKFSKNRNCSGAEQWFCSQAVPFIGLGHQSYLTLWCLLDCVTVMRPVYYLPHQLLDRDRQMGVHTSRKLVHNSTALPCSHIQILLPLIYCLSAQTYAPHTAKPWWE